MDARSPLEIRALRYLAQREYSRLELEQKLSVHARSLPSEDLSSVLDQLERRGLLSAERVVEQIVRTRRARFGNRRILHELKEKGIDEHLIHSILPSLKETELEAAMRIWQKKFGLSPNNREERSKQIRFMMNRGFSIEVIQQVFSQAGEDNQ